MEIFKYIFMYTNKDIKSAEISPSITKQKNLYIRGYLYIHMIILISIYT